MRIKFLSSPWQGYQHPHMWHIRTKPQQYFITMVRWPVAMFGGPMKPNLGTKNDETSCGKFGSFQRKFEPALYTWLAQVVEGLCIVNSSFLCLTFEKPDYNQMFFFRTPPGRFVQYTWTTKSNDARLEDVSNHAAHCRYHGALFGGGAPGSWKWTKEKSQTTLALIVTYIYINIYNLLISIFYTSLIDICRYVICMAGSL